MFDRREAARLQALRQLKLLDTPASESFDRVTRMASKLFGLPIAAVSLTDEDRQWFKSRVGVDHDSLPRSKAPCAQVTDERALLVIDDLLADACYAASPLAATGVRFYAGAPLVTREGFALGALCVLGTEPRNITAEEAASLQDMAAIVMSEIELQHAFGRIDALTGLPNHVQLDDDIQDLAHTSGERRCLVLVDIATADQLSQLMLGRGSGVVDDLILETAQMLREGLSADRQLYHVAAGQFAFLAPPDMDDEGYVTVLETHFRAMREATSSRFIATASVGLAPFVLGQSTIADVLRSAYAAAVQARDTDARVSRYGPEQDGVYARRIWIIDEFGQALQRQEGLQLAYQPRIDLRTGECVGAEALLRWTHPEIGAVSPGEFIPLIEQTDLAGRLTEWVLGQAIGQCLRWRREGLSHKVSINVSATNLREPDFAVRVLRHLLEAGLTPSDIELELTESVLVGNSGQAMDQLRALADAGFTLALDDFGTGYSSLSYLQIIPAQVLKIDQSFIREMAHDERRQTLVGSMIALSHDLGYRVVAEGIETQAIADMLVKAECDEVQGYFFGRPMLPHLFDVWLRQRSPATVHAAA